MIVTAWKGGHYKKGQGTYGLRVSISDRDKLFKKSWKSVQLKLWKWPKTAEVRICPSFWNKCSELKSKEIKSWLCSKKLDNWPKGKPPKFSLEPVSEACFIVKLL